MPERDSDNELGEDDLFGSEDDENVGVASLPALGAPFLASPGRGLERTPQPDGTSLLSPLPSATPIPSEKDLFGEDSDGGEVDEKALFGSEDEGEAHIDEKDLFGSDEEGGAPTQRDGGQPRTPGAASEVSEMDEREIFGDVSDEEPEKVEDIILRRRPAPGDDRVFATMRLPNTLSIEKMSFNAEHLSAAAVDGYKDFKNTANKKMTRLLNPENCVRWRFKKGPDGHNLTDEDGRPQYESNSRFVEWEDGTKTLYVGREAFNLMELDDNVYLFEENSQDVHVCHGHVPKRLICTPQSLNSVTHANVKKSQYRTFQPNRRSLLMSQEEQDANTALQQLSEDHKKMQLRDEQRVKRNLEQGQGGMTAAFLEDDQPGAGVGPSIMDIKQAAKRETKRQRSG